MTGGESPSETPADAPPVTSDAPSQSPAEPKADPMQQVLQNMEAVCGERYRSGVAANDHARFFRLAAFGDHCAHKNAPNEKARTKLRAWLAQNCDAPALSTVNTHEADQRRLNSLF